MFLFTESVTLHRYALLSTSATQPEEIEWVSAEHWGTSHRCSRVMIEFSCGKLMADATRVEPLLNIVGALAQCLSLSLSPDTEMIHHQEIYTRRKPS